MLCGYRDDERLWNAQADAADEARQRRIEDYADLLLADCMNPVHAESINNENDLYDSDLLTRMIVAVANWTGSTESSVTQMRKLHNLLADALQGIAERKIK
jgi:hypothetical protein